MVFKNKRFIGILLSLLMIITAVPLSYAENSKNIERKSNEVTEKNNNDNDNSNILEDGNEFLKSESNQGNVNPNIIDNKEKLLAFLKKQEEKAGENSIVGGEYIINGRIEINSSELPDKPLNVYGSKITGENAEIIITLLLLMMEVHQGEFLERFKTTKRVILLMK